MSRLKLVRMTRDQRAGFTQIANTVVRPQGALSAGAVGVLAHLLSHEEGWDVSAERLTRVFSSKLPTVKGLLQELERAGHLERRRWNTSTGFVHEWVVHEDPIGGLATDGLSTDGLITGGNPAGIKKTTEKKTTEKKTGSAPPSHGSSADFEAIEAILADNDGGHLDAAETWDAVRYRHGGHWPVSWLRSLADEGELSGLIGSGGLDPMEPIDVDVPEDVVGRRAVGW